MESIFASATISRGADAFRHDLSWSSVPKKPVVTTLNVAPD
jgi:hypothetical protein